jgi:hypothetical protein
LLAKIRVPEENAPEVDAFEASRIIEQLSQAEVDDVVQAGDAFRVTLRVLGGIVTHVLKIASAKDVTEYRRGFARVPISPTTARNSPSTLRLLVLFTRS